MLELMVVITVLALLVTLAVPSFSGLILRNRLSAAVEDIVAAVDLARNEAIMRSYEVRLIPVDATDWGAGLQVVVDNERKGNFDDGLLFRSEAVRAGLTLERTDDNNHKDIVFNALGQISNLGDARAVELLVKSSDCSHPSMMQIKLMPSGEIQVTQEECA